MVKNYYGMKYSKSVHFLWQVGFEGFHERTYLRSKQTYLSVQATKLKITLHGEYGYVTGPILPTAFCRAELNGIL